MESKNCRQSCERYPRNYHCWVYRWWCFSQVFQQFNVENRTCCQGQVQSALFKTELAEVAQWIEHHPADYAACHYFHLLADTVLRGSSGTMSTNQSTTQDINRAVLKQLNHTKSSIRSLYASYESVWYHRRWCIITVANDDRAAIAAMVDEELEFAESVLKRHENDQTIFDLVTKHKAWLAVELC
ncbi:hypothetical protein GGF37_002667 [Kickxella alabastrina]|nr:hypothetical protein GGF37_002667 [Kickxella alabastrina]